MVVERGEHVRTSICFGLTLCVICLAQSDEEKKTVDSFKGYVQHHLDSYKTNRRERVTFLSGGWVQQYYEADVSSAEIDVQRTSSLISPYTGKLEFRMIRRYTAFHKSREEAVVDTVFSRVEVTTHRHNYAYQDGKWVPRIRQHRVPEVERLLGSITWYDCAEVIKVGPDAGETNLKGCLEEYDDVKR
jgi:hypothetical protein